MAQISSIGYAKSATPSGTGLRAVVATGAAQPPTDARRLLRIVTLIWLGYILMQWAVDTYFVAVNPLVRPLPTAYYLSQGLVASAVLGLVVVQRVGVWLGRCFLPLVIVGLSALPLATTALTVPSSLVAPISGTGGLVGNRSLPILAVAVVLIAWQYRWKQVVLFSFGTFALVGMFIISQRTGIVNRLAVTAITTLGLLILGYAACALMERLRAQRVALEQANMQLRHYATTLEQLAVSRERNRVARELHDTLAHTLSGLTVQLETTKAYWAVDPAAAGALVDTALQTARDGLQETRRSLKALRATPLDDLGLRQALCRMAERATASANLKLDCMVAEDLPILAPDVEQCIYRVAQEAVANATQHAAATTLLLRLDWVDGRLRLHVADNGHGFDERGTKRPGHFGLAGMYERAALAGGDLSVRSVPGTGTTVDLQL